MAMKLWIAGWIAECDVGNTGRVVLAAILEKRKRANFNSPKPSQFIYPNWTH